MNIFDKSDNQRKEYCLIGLSTFNYEIGKTLIGEGHKVTVIDNDSEKIDTLGEEFNHAVVCDSTKLAELKDIGVEFFDYVILGISDMKASVITAAHLKELEVKKVLAKAKDKAHRKILNMLGISITYIPEEEVSTKVAYKIMHDLNVELFSFDKSMHDVIVVQIPVLNSTLWNKKISEIDFMKNMSAIIISIKRKNGEMKIPVVGNDVIMEEDNVCLLCKKNLLIQLKAWFDHPVN